MNYLREGDTLFLSIPSAIFTAFGAGCRYLEFSEQPAWREVGWAGARFFPYIATVAAAPLFIHRFACAIILRIVNHITGKQVDSVVNITEFMERRLAVVITAISMIPIIILNGPWIFKSSDNVYNFAAKSRAFYADTLNRFNNEARFTH